MCQQSIKYVNEERGFIDDYVRAHARAFPHCIHAVTYCITSTHGRTHTQFVFTCGPGYPRVSYISPQRENSTDAATGMRHENGAYDMYVRNSAFKFITHYEWNSEVVGDTASSSLPLSPPFFVKE